MAIKSSSVLAPELEKLAKTKSSLTYGTACTYLLMCAGGQHHVQHLVRGHAGGGPDRVLPA